MFTIFYLSEVSILRVHYFDYLKVFAILGVVIIHTTSNTIVHVDVTSFEWMVANFYNSLSRVAVPIFFMVSGALLLSSKGNNGLGNFYKKRVTKLFIPFFLWSIFYYVLFGLRGDYGEEIGVLEFVTLFLSGDIYGRLWFFYSLLGLYILTPFLKTMVQNLSQQHLKVYLYIWFATTVLYISLNKFFSIDFAIDLTYIYGYVGYFILGYYLKNFDVKINKYTLYTLLIMMLGLTFVGTQLTSVNNDAFYNYFYQYLAPNNIIIAFVLFLIFKEQIKITETPKLSNLIGMNTLGIYLIHTFVLIVFSNIGFKPTIINPIIGIPLVAIFTMIISLLISITIKMIPILRNILP